ncbi:RHS repeat-associated core domain-containing protein [Streptacidiphilus neutrinimicus]|uniref:RHS repeat-associated core domain-containing protein n=1 Tax=Streptacidiphilus neutrinimicus TaxID=105420 RepID=UPI0006949C1F|nr:RHS repeat-associated core domain-containing protein [Streptacidiphilus neutrinimicus]
MSGQIAHAMEDAARKAEQGLAQDFSKAYHSILKDTEEKTTQVAEHAAENEAKTVEDLGKSAEHATTEPHEPHPDGGGPGPRPAPGNDENLLGDGRQQVADPHDAGRGDEGICEGGEPVDMATGRMFIEQVDAALPGVLPLRLTRRFESGYQAGRWMGRRWACTFDERLEIDDEGIVHLGADGRTQAYPHPEPGECVQASAGARRDLEVEPGERGYVLTDRKEGIAREFTVQPGGSEALLTRVRGRGGDHYDLVYDRHGVPQEIRHSGGYRLLVSVADGRLAEIRLAGAAADGGDQALVGYGYEDGRLTEVRNSSGLPLRFLNDAWGRVTSWIDRNGSRYDYVYDAAGRVVEEGGADGALHFTFRYGSPDPQTGVRRNEVTNALGHTTAYEVNGRHQITAVTDPLGHTTRYERDAFDRLLSRTDALGRAVRYVYDEQGDLVAITRPDGEQTLLAYADELPLPTHITEPGGRTWQQRFDHNGHRVELTDPLGAVTRWTYDEQGHLASVTDPYGATTAVVCDAAGQPVQVTDALGATTRIARDAFGRPCRVTDALGRTTTTTWTVEGQPATRVHPDGATESWTWDGEGNLLSHTDPAGRTTAFEYTHFETLAARTTADGARVAFTHDADMQLVGVTDALGRQWAYQYDAAGRLTGETDYNGRTTRYDLDAAGQIVTRTNPAGQTISYRYDVLGQLVAKDGDNSAVYGYDLVGNLVSATDAQNRLLRTHDALGNLLSESVAGRTLTHTRDQAGRRTRRTTPSGHATEWSRDAAGMLVSVRSQDNVIDFSYDPVGRECTRRFDAALTLDTSWDERDRPTAQTLTVAGITPSVGSLGATGSPVTTLLRRTYGWAPDDNLTSIADQRSGTRHFELDAVGRPITVHRPDGAENYAYDKAGDLVDARWRPAADGPAEGPRNHAGTDLVSAGRVRYEYDAAGRVTVRQVKRLSAKPDTWRYAWNGDDQLVQVTTPDGTVWRYLYDPLGRRTAKLRLAGDGTIAERTDFTWDENRLVEQTTVSPHLPGPYAITWEHDGFTPLSQTETITTVSGDQERVDRRFFAIVTDLVGTPTELVDPADQTIAWRASSSLWGNTAWPASSTAYTPLRFPGQYFDPETRLHYNLFRYYDPETARYTSPDPLGLLPGPNPQAYVPNPLLWIDPLGLSAHKRSGEPQEINWSPKSVKTFGHAFKDHGQKKTIQQMADRARNKGGPQGRWLDDAKAAEVMRANYRPGLTKATDAYVIDIPEGLGVEVSEDGTVVPVLHAIVVPSPGGLIKSGYPTSKTAP